MRERLQKAIEYAIETGSFSKINQAEKAEWVCVFGLGRYFEEAFEYWKFEEKLGVNILCDNDSAKWGNVYKGLKCISPEELYQLENVIVIPMIGDFSIIEEQLKSHNLRYIIPSDVCFEIIADMPRDIEWFEKNEIMNVYSLLEDEHSKEVYCNILCNRIAPQFSEKRYAELQSGNEYFNEEFFKFDDKEVFVDCGAYDGDSLKAFLKHVEYKFDKSILFEMDGDNFLKLTKNKEMLPIEIKKKIECVHAGVWNENSEMEYGKEEHGTGESFSLLKSEHSVKVKTVKIDDAIPRTQNVTLIKMDIEGAELNALKGAEETIKRWKPNLAICIYHKLNDFWEIPMYIKSIVPEYKIGIRHHQNNLGGTVLYAYI